MIPMIATAARQPITLLLPPDSEAPATTTVVMDRCVLAIEKLYFQNNQKTAIMVAEARGIILLAAQKLKIPIYEYTPLQVKTAVTGYGKAKKPQVMEMTRRLLHLAEVPKPDDTADALAIAICHAQAAGSALRRKMFERG